MGLLDQLAGQMLGGNTDSGANPMMGLVKALIENTEGGLPGLLSRLQGGGLGDQVASWLGQGQNEAVDADALSPREALELIYRLRELLDTQD